MALSTIPFSALSADASKQGINFRNLIINGDMSIAQRGTVTGITAGSYGGADRFRLGIGSMGTWTMSQENDAPSGQGFATSLKIACTTADASPASTDEAVMNYRFEGQMVQSLKKGTANAESVTLSFWVKSNKTGTYIAELFDTDNLRHINKSYTIDSAGTWEKKIITFAGDTTGTLDNDNVRSLQLNMWIGAGSDSQSGTLQTSWGTNTYANRAIGQVNLADSTSNYINFTGVQLEVGTSASDFEFLPFDVNLQRCYRYYQKSFLYSDAPAQNINTNEFMFNAVEGGSTDARGSYIFPVEMRTAPTVTTFNPFASNSSFRKPNSSTDIAVSVQSRAKFFYIGTSGSGTTALHGHFTADSEL